MNRYTIFTDGGVDLPETFWKETGVRGLPMDYLLDGESHTYDPTENRQHACRKFYSRLAESKSVSTSQITPFAFTEAFESELREGRDVMYCGFSGGLSSTFQVAQSVARALKETYPDRTVRCVDTKGAAAGGGLLVRRAADNQRKGINLEDNARDVELMVPNLCHWFTVGDLDFLKRGGRVSPAVAFVGGKLNIKPILCVDGDGRLVVSAKIRGMNAAMKWMLEKAKAQVPATDPVEIAVVYGGQKETAQELARMVQQAIPNAQPELSILTPIIGAHTGPDILALCYLSKDPQR